VYRWVTGKPITVIPLFPEVPCTIQHPVEAHGGVPVEEMHYFRQIFWSGWFYQVVDVVGHDAQRVKFEVIFVQTFFDCI
jgi:hypothetical protein